MTAAAQPDVAFISWRSQSGRSGGSGLALRCSHAYDESHWQTQTFGEIPDHKVTDVRPLVVIDTEDREQVERLTDWMQQHGWTGLDDEAPDDMADALRSLIANPKPAESTGLGAVVEDSEGKQWVHFGNRCWIKTVPNAALEQRTWPEIDAVRVLSEGVQP